MPERIAKKLSGDAKRFLAWYYCGEEGGLIIAGEALERAIAESARRRLVRLDDDGVVCGETELGRQVAAALAKEGT